MEQQIFLKHFEAPILPKKTVSKMVDKQLKEIIEQENVKKEAINKYYYMEYLRNLKLNNGSQGKFI